MSVTHKVNTEVVLFPVMNLIPYANNAKLHPEEQVLKIAGQIAAFGFDQPIVARREDKVLVKGHGRWLAAQKLGMDQVPVIFVDLDEYQAMAARIADNKVSQTSFDIEKLHFDLGTLDRVEFDLKLTAFDDKEIEQALSLKKFLSDQNLTSINDSAIANVGDNSSREEALKEWKGMPEFDQPDKQSFKHVIVHFENMQDFEAFFNLIDQEHTDKTKSIWFPPKERNDFASSEYKDSVSEQPAQQ